MAVKLSDRKGALFIGLYEIKAKINDDMKEVAALYDKVRFFERPEKYAVNGWGYDQTNHENIIVVGKLGGCYLAILEDSDHVFSIGAKKFDNKDDWTNLDGRGVRHTSWGEPYEAREHVSCGLGFR